MRLQTLVVVVLLAAPGLALAQQPAENLELTASAPDHVAGSFTKDGTQVHFDVKRTSERATLELRSASNKELFSGTIDRQTFSMSILDGRLTARGMTPPDLKTTPPLETSGDSTALDELTETAEYKLLPYLSRALGEKGITGRSHPASMGLHLFGAASAGVHKVRLPPLEAKAGARALAADPSAKCFDQTGDPCDDACFGMCGSDCNCWSWVCGDCCVNTNCLLHDTLCSQCQCQAGTEHLKTACFLCYLPLTVLLPSPAFLCLWQTNPCPNQAACKCSNLTTCSAIKGSDCGWCLKDDSDPLGANVARYGSSSGPGKGSCQNWIWSNKDCNCAAMTSCKQIKGTDCGWCVTYGQAMPGGSAPKYQPAGNICLNWIQDNQDCECASITQCSKIEKTNCGWCTTLGQAMPKGKSGPKYQPAGTNCTGSNWISNPKNCP
jgi:hypothetical protein